MLCKKKRIINLTWHDVSKHRLNLGLDKMKKLFGLSAKD